MKLQGIVGKGTGRLGASVFVVRKGEQIVRQYNPNVANPRTQGQVDQRAKFKLMSQLSAIAANGIAFLGLPAGRSQRNEFVKRNIGHITLSDHDVAIFETALMELTNGNIAAPTITRTDDQLAITIDASTAAGVWDGIGYVAVTAPTLEGPIFGMSEITPKGTLNASIPVLQALQSKTVVRAFAYKFRDANARAKYENIVDRDEAAALSLNFSRMVNEGEIVVSTTVTATAGA